MEYSVPVLSIVFMAVCMLAGVAIPLVLLLFLRKKYRCDILPFFVGCAVMLVFALVLEQVVHYFVLNSTVGDSIKGNYWLYAVYGGLMAGVFEESGRFIAFKTILRKKLVNDRNALMYGAGHGGFEAFYILAASMLNNIVISIMLNTGNAEVITSGLSGDALAALLPAFEQLSSTEPALFLVSIFERLAAVAAQLSLSVLVWFAAKKGGKILLLYPLAITLHLVLDAAAVIINSFVSHVMITELAVWVIAGVCVLIAVLVWRKHRSTDAYDAEQRAKKQVE